MKTFANLAPRDMRQAVAAAQQVEQQGKAASFAGGGSDLLALVKERIVTPDVIISLRSIAGADRVTSTKNGVTIGGLITLSALSQDATVLKQYAVLAQAAESVATPQIRNVGTLAGNVCQRPWCWYFRNGFPCFKAGGNQCFSYDGENQFHAIFGGGPSYIVHPSDTAVALVALDARFRVMTAGGERTLSPAEFFVLPRQKATAENALASEDVVTAIALPPPATGTRSAYRKVLDRAAWTHAVVSAAIVLHMDKDVCREARIVLGGVAPIPWRVPEAERLLAGQRITAALAATVAERALTGARPLAKNGYKIPLTKALVRRTVIELATPA
ncbi:MAG TPA: FAD binding domain-containing protein [Vicinamibacterales bacterium]|jgi:xanthine dehydrogenase YagS FAD-binding subunit